MQALIRANAPLLFAGTMTFVVMGIGQSLYGPALPAIRRVLDIGQTEAGLLLSAHWVGSAVGIALMFLYGARITPRHALAVMAAGAAGVALMAGLPLTVVSVVLFGTGYGMATAVFNPRVLVAFGDKGPSMLSLLNACYGIGAILSPLAFVWLGSDPKVAFGLTSAVCGLIWLGAGARGRAVQGAASAGRFRLHKGILAFGAVAVGLEASLIGLGPSALIVAGQTETRAAELFSVFFVLFVLGRVALVFAAHLLPAFVLLTAALGVAALGALTSALLSPATGFVIMGAAAGLFFPGFYVSASEKLGDDHRVPPTIIAAGLVGGISAPLILAPLMTSLGDRSFFWIIAIITLAATAGALMALREMLSPPKG